jgi:peptidoglycan-associated lipoprotein
MLDKRKIGTIGFCLMLALFAAGCKKKAPPPPPPPPPPAPEVKPAPAAPSIVEFVAEPSSIERGQSSTLRWNVTNADNVSIDNGIGSVAAGAQRRVFPSDSTTYTLTATGPGGTKTATASVNVAAPPPPPPPPAPVAKLTLDQMLSSTVVDAFFDYDKSDIREDARAALSKDAEALKAIFTNFPDTITIEGHCDERGSAEYNLALGDRRATSAKSFLTQLGVPGDKLNVKSYGKEHPQCTDSNEECWQKNRRVHFSTGQ